MASNYLQAIIEACQADVKTREGRLRSGNLEYTDYKHLCGQILGLEHAIEHVKSLMQKMETDDE